MPTTGFGRCCQAITIIPPPAAYRHSSCSTVSITGMQFLILAILVAERSVSNKDFICISLVNNEAEHFFMFTGHLVSSICEMTVP